MEDKMTEGSASPDPLLIKVMEIKLDSVRTLIGSDPKSAKILLREFFEDANRLIAAAQVPGALQAYGADCTSPDALERLRSAIQTGKELSAQIAEMKQ